ncbi:UDP-glucose 4-epimerase GalE [Canibacter sp. lx-72]|uniref:UDP-glucose 4-epimerase GalE n=1 Tax=Canibacter zhuwentaonis TaxID=2837491 RepID=UPI001BDC031F|nr:UDP-glucose 4-epimerase GalE [Canibacter zhuwentaonis]MBT1018651.1 UDP-glucose 4-epimerase GalE [Canibacter zhuwentaonis]MBT1035839.1 UDP-glucose 4-epimerase GalE [Canibacter zhuwentaonis]
MHVILTGGAGYIGSHTAVVLAERGHTVTIIDDFSNSHPAAVERVRAITGANIELREADLTDSVAAAKAFAGLNADAVIHFAGLKAVGESVAEPIRYYRVNINSALNVLDQIRERGIKTLVFSSSATVYGDPQALPIDETQPVGVGLTNPYGWSKAMIEQIIRDAAVAQGDLAAVLLRYFNPVGAHPSGQIGEDPSGIPNNLMPFVSQVAVGKRAKLSVFGDGYKTKDGTGVRDYIHVMDLAAGHAAALEHAQAGVTAYNLGSGEGSSVFEVIAAFEQVSGRKIAYDVAPPRSGDVAEVVANPAKANRELNWRTELSLEQACRDSWKWQSQNPGGYLGSAQETP